MSPRRWPSFILTRRQSGAGSCPISTLFGRRPVRHRFRAGEKNPVAAVALRYLATPVDVEMAARELGLDDVEELKELVRGNEILKSWQLGPLAEGKPVPRAVWAENDLGRSPFRDVARLLKLGLARRHP